METKNKIFLALFIFAFVFFATNKVQADKTETSPSQEYKVKNQPRETMAHPNQQRENLIPQLIHQEIEKVKTLRRKNSNNGLYTPEALADRPDRQDGVGDMEGGTSSTTSERPELQNRKKTTSQAVRERNRNRQIQRFAQRVTKRFMALGWREEQISNRIGTRITKLEAKGYELLAVRNLLTESQNKLNKATLKIAPLESNMANLIQSSASDLNIARIMERMREQIAPLKQEFQTVHKGLVHIVKNIRQELSAQSMVDNNEENSENKGTTANSGADE